MLKRSWRRRSKTEKKIPLKYDDKETEMTLYQIVGASILARNKKQNKNSSG